MKYRIYRGSERENLEIPNRPPESPKFAPLLQGFAGDLNLDVIDVILVIGGLVIR